MRMNEDIDRYLQIREYLQELYPQAVSISAITRELGMNRGSVAKYLEVLLSQGHVIVKPYGRSKLFSSSRNVPFDDLFDYISDAIVILDADLRILMVNKKFYASFGIQKGKNVIGIGLSKLSLSIFNDHAVQTNIDRIMNSQTYINEMLLIEKGTERIFLTEFTSITIPSISFAGKPGIMISLRNITTWKKAEDELKNSERKIRTLFEEVPSGIIIFQEDGTILNANKASLAILGLKKFTDLADLKLFDIICSQEKIIDLMEQQKVAEITLPCNFDRLKKNELFSTVKSGIAYLQIVFAPVPEKKWNSQREFFILFLDITAQKLAEKELKDRIKGIASNLPGIVYQFYSSDTGEWGMHFVDERSHEILGLDPEPLDTYFDRLIECIAPEDRVIWLKSVQDVVKEGIPWDFECRFIKTTGEDIFIRGISQPTRLKNETIWNGLFLDVTDRKRVEIALRKNEERFRGIAGNLPGIVYQFFSGDNGEVGMYYVDERSQDVYGVSPEPLNDWIERYGNCIDPDYQKQWINSMNEALLKRSPWDFEGKFIKHRGEEMYVRVISQPVRLEHETVWNGIILDITEYKKAEEALRISMFKEIRYHSFFENTCNGVLIYEPVRGGDEYILKDVNKVTANLLRMKQEDLIGKKLFEEFPDLPDPQIRDMLKRVLTTENPEFVAPIKYRNKENFPWISHYVFKLPSGEIASFMIDVSDEVTKNISQKAPG